MAGTGSTAARHGRISRGSRAHRWWHLPTLAAVAVAVIATVVPLLASGTVSADDHVPEQVIMSEPIAGWLPDYGPQPAATRMGVATISPSNYAPGDLVTITLTNTYAPEVCTRPTGAVYAAGATLMRIDWWADLVEGSTTRAGSMHSVGPPSQSAAPPEAYLQPGEQISATFVAPPADRITKPRVWMEGHKLRPTQCTLVLAQPRLLMSGALELVDVTPPLLVTMSSDGGNHAIGDQVGVTMELRNTAASPITEISLPGDTGLSFSGEHLELVSGPDPAPPTALAPGESVTLDYVVEPTRSGILEVRGSALGTLDGGEVSGSDTTRVAVPPDLEVELTTSVTSATRAGDEFEVVATLTNHDTEEITGIRAEPLVALPERLVTAVSGPTDSNGNDPRAVPLSIPAGGAATIRWTLRAEDRGAVDLTAQISGRDPREGSLFFLSESTSVGIEAAALVMEDVRLQPGSIVPGEFGTIRGTLTNAGSVDVRFIDFELSSTPELVVVEGVLSDLDPSVSPRIDWLEPEQTREFVIPVAMVIDSGDLGSYRFDLRMAGTAEIGGESVEVVGTATAGEGLDLTTYWSTILDDVRANLLSDTIEFFEGVNDWGDSSTLGGVVVGSSGGALNVFQSMGDGLLGVNDYIAEEIGSGGERLTGTANSVVAASREYLHTHTAKEMAADLKSLGYDVTVGGVGIFGEWLRDVDRAQASGDVREVSRLLAEPATMLVTAGGAEVAVERVAGQLFAKAVQSGVGRKVASYMKRAPEPVEEDWIWLPDSEHSPDKLVGREVQDLKDMPTGVAITGETVARSGLTADEHGWMIDMAREHGVAFFVRPRPETAAKFAKLGYNAKPMAIKLKSISEIDHRWLGWDDYAESEGLVVFREPKDPLLEMMDAVEDGTLEFGGPESKAIVERYNLRLAEWKSYEKPFGEAGPTVDPRDGILHKLNGDTLGPDGEIIPGEGFTIQRYGKTIRTKVTIDPDGVIKFTHNNKPVYSDIDLLAIAKPDGSHIPAEVHQEIARRAGAGIDSQHGDSVLTSDFPNWDTAKKFAVQYANEHKRGGDPLVIVQPDVTTLGYVDNVTVPEGAVPGSDYDLYGVIQTTYEGAGRL